MNFSFNVWLARPAPSWGGQHSGVVTSALAQMTWRSAWRKNETQQSPCRPWNRPKESMSARHWSTASKTTEEKQHAFGEDWCVKALIWPCAHALMFSPPALGVSEQVETCRTACTKCQRAWWWINSNDSCCQNVKIALNSAWMTANSSLGHLRTRVWNHTF